MTAMPAIDSRSGREFEPRLEMVKIWAKNLSATDALILFLQRGWNVTNIPGYYSVSGFKFDLFERSLTFTCARETLNCPPVNSKDRPHFLANVPEFKVQFDTTIMVQSELFGQQRQWAQREQVPISIVDEIMSWGFEWKIEFVIVERIPIFDVSEIARMAKSARAVRHHRSRNEDYEADFLKISEANHRPRPID